MLGHYPHSEKHIYSPCPTCALPTADRILHTCSTLLPGQTWYSLTQSRHPDTAFWSFRLADRACIRAVTVWESKFVNGFQLRLHSLTSNTDTLTEKVCGQHDSPHTTTTVELGEGEYIVSCLVHIGVVLDQLSFETSKGNKYTFGGSGGTPRAIAIPEGMAVVGLFGGVGGHIHTLGFYLDKVGNLVFERRRLYFLVRHKAKSTPETSQHPAALLLSLTPDTFRQVVQFL